MMLWQGDTETLCHELLLSVSCRERHLILHSDIQVMLNHRSCLFFFFFLLKKIFLLILRSAAVLEYCREDTLLADWSPRAKFPVIYKDLVVISPGDQNSQTAVYFCNYCQIPFRVRRIGLTHDLWLPVHNSTQSMLIKYHFTSKSI